MLVHRLSVTISTMYNGGEAARIKMTIIVLLRTRLPKFGLVDL